MVARILCVKDVLCMRVFCVYEHYFVCMSVFCVYGHIVYRRILCVWAHFVAWAHCVYERIVCNPL